MDISNWICINKNEVFSNNYLRVRNDKVQNPKGKEVEFSVVESKNFTATICMTKDEKIVMIKQYRYPWSSVSIEIPAGLIEPEEDPTLSAKREVREETGYKVLSIEPLLTWHPVAFSSSWGHLYFAIVEKEGNQKLDENEFIEVLELSKSEVEKMIQRNVIIHGATILGWYVAKTKKLL
ncbi:MAG: NUDIX hydrolase [Candidatus Heimdallarchaeum aukensis]|uniref:NUDIX hydrolase n=1 Tax=Candidatus Heimdallarchaeum aukensis TaxID=2876573 RepID=A0A9Y1BL69_9ARCH|nr:MAG: NUDIX hydrolase [Candidatus Heimdallarchaeum aukensis]